MFCIVISTDLLF